MDIKFIKELAELMEKENLLSAQICIGENSVNLTRAFMPSSFPPAQPAVCPTTPNFAPIPTNVPVTATGEALNSPLVGIGYTAAEPGAAAFVSVGSSVVEGQILCIIEAMKVMNEFTAQKDGVITEICFKDGDLLEFGQCLFRMA